MRAEPVSLPLPDPMTIGFVGTCAGAFGGLTAGVFALLSEDRQGPSGIASLYAALLGASAGLLAWLLGLFGVIEQTAYFFPDKPDLFAFVSCATSLATFFSGLVLLYLRYRMGLDMDIVRWFKIAALVWFVAAVVVYARFPSLHS